MNKLNKNKRAQITIFIIIGIVVLFIAGMFMYLSGESKDISDADIEKIEDVPFQIRPVQEFITTCIKQTATEGLIKLGQHGGYIDVLDLDLTPKEFIIDPLDPSSSDAVTLTFDKSTHIPYWYYMNSNHNCINCVHSTESVPENVLIEEQINKYVKREIPKCIDGFKKFKSNGFSVEELGNINVETKIAKKDVLIQMTYPVSVTVGESTSEMNKYIARVDLNLQSILDIAKSITLAQMSNNFLERLVIHLIALYSDNSMDALPPIYATDNSYVPNFWFEPMVEEQLKQILTSHIPLIKLNGTKNAKPYELESELANKLYNQFFISVLNQSYEDYEIRFMYLDFPLYLHITPQTNGKLEPTSYTDQFKLLGFGFGSPVRRNYYEFFYDVEFPVVVEITKENEFNDEPYRFLFGLEGHIKDNRDPIAWDTGNGTIGEWDRSIITFDSDSEVSKELAPESPEEEQLFGGSQKYTKRIICEPSQRISAPITIKTFTSKNKSSIDGALVRYSCGTYASCTMGTTQFSEDSDDAILKSSFPICIGGGTLTIDKPGYAPLVIPNLDTTQDQDPQEFEIFLEPYRTKTVKVNKFILDRVIFLDDLYKELKFIFWNNKLESLTEDDLTIINLIKIQNNPYEEKFSKTIIYYGNESLNSPMMTELDLLPGRYIIEAQYFDKKTIIFSANCSHMCGQCDNDYDLKDCRLRSENYTQEYDCNIDEWSPEENTTIDMMVLGGMRINETKPFIIDASDLDSSSIIEFRVVQVPRLRCIEDFEDLGEVEKFYDLNRGRLNPVLK